MNIKKHRTDEELVLEALKYKTRTEFAKCSNGAYQAAKRRGILDKICSHMPIRCVSTGHKPPNYRWTDELLAQEALKYKNKTDFIKNAWGAYQAARDRGILDKICAHMPKRRKIPREWHSHFKWTFEKIKEEAFQYKSREEFRKNSGGAWSAAQDLGILDIVCAHMPWGGNSSNGELTLFDIIKNIYHNTKKLVDTKVVIDGRSYIKGFEIDIFVPELNLGIEFDGKYHHSFKGLKRSRPHWPKDAILNYHEIKDAWFATKGIKILHIKEKDWENNKESCITKCLEFLSSPI